VHVIRNEVCYELSYIGNGFYGSPSNPYTQDCPDCGLVMNPGDTIFLEIFHFGKVASAHTVIPPKPANFTMSRNQLVVPASGRVDDNAVAFELTWDAQGDFWYYVELINLDNPKQPVGGGDQVYGYIPPYISEPVRDKRFIINWGQLPYYGRYRVKVVAINREYVELLLTRNQDSRDLNEPASNVTNGLGIFTAINSAYLDFTVTD